MSDKIRLHIKNRLTFNKQRSNQKFRNLLDASCKANQVIELSLLLGEFEPLEKGDDSFLLIGDVSLTFVLV